MRLIFIEGVSGVGKTTLAQKLCNKLNEMGYLTNYYLEFDFTNPIDFYCTAYFRQEEYENLLSEFPDYSDDIKGNTIIAEDIRLVRYYNGKTALFTEPLLDVLFKHEFCYKPNDPVPLSEYTRVYKLIWDMFAQETSIQFDFLLFDGSLFHHPINDLIRNYNSSCDQVAYHVNTLVESVNLLRPLVVYLSADNICEQLHKAHICRKQTPPSAEQIQFWEDRKQMDLAMMQQLSIPYDIYNISCENWDSLIDVIVMRILENDKERQARIYPIILSEYNPAWPEWFAEEKVKLERLIGTENIARISHFGSTSVPGLAAKPTVDILLEIQETADIDKLITSLPQPEYICLNPPDMPTPPPHLVFLKGYTPTGFAEKIYHIHVRYPDEWDELHFRDYLIANPVTAAEYAELKRKLFKEFEFNRDGYTDAKSVFIKEITKKVRAEVSI